MNETASKKSNPVKEKLTVKVILLIIAACLFFGILCGFRTDFSIVLGIMESTSGIFSYVDLQIANGICHFVTAVAAPLVAFLTLKSSNFFVLTLGMITTVAGLFMIAVADSFPVLVIGLGILFAFGTAALSFGIIYAIISPLLGERVAIVVSTLFTTLASSFAVFFSPMIQGLSDTLGYQNMLIIFCIVLACIYPLVLVLSGKKEKEVLAKEKKEIRFKSALSSILKNKYFYVLILFALVLGITSGFRNHFYVGLVNLDYYSMDVSVTYSVMMALWAVASLIMAIFIVKVRKTIQFGAFLFLLFSLSLLTVVIFVTNDLPFLPIIILTAVINSVLTVLLTLIARREFSPILLATVFSVITFFQKTGSGINGILGSVIFETTGNFNQLAVIEIIIAISFACLLFCYPFIERYKIKRISMLYLKNKEDISS